MILLFTILFNVLEAVHEALYDNGSKLLSGIIEAILKALIVSIALAWFAGIHLFNLDYIPFWKLFTGFVFVRFLMFDVIYNVIRGLPLLFMGSTKLFDKIFSKVPASFLAFVRVVLGIIGICFLIGVQ